MGCPFSWKDYVGIWFATLVGYHIDIIRAQAIEKRGNDILHCFNHQFFEFRRISFVWYSFWHRKHPTY